MTAKAYNVALVIGLALIGVGVGMVNLPAAFVTVGALVIALTLFAVLALRRR